jgi:hypothetical protein
VGSAHILTVKLCSVKKTARKTELNVLWHNTGFQSGLSVFCLFCESSCQCECGIVTFGHNQSLNSVQSKCLFSVSQSSCNDLYAPMNAKCNLSFNHFGRLHAFRDDAIVVSAGKLRKLWDTQSKLRSSLCKRGLEIQS